MAGIREGAWRRLAATAATAILAMAGCGSSSNTGQAGNAGGGGGGKTHASTINPCKLVDASTASQVLGTTATLDSTLNQTHVDHDSVPDGTAAIDSTCVYDLSSGKVELTLVQPDRTSSSKQPMGVAGASALLSLFKVFFPGGTSAVSGLGDEAYKATGSPSGLYVGSTPGSNSTDVFARDGDILILAILPSGGETQAQDLLRAAFASADSGSANGPVQPNGAGS